MSQSSRVSDGLLCAAFQAIQKALGGNLSKPHAKRGSSSGGGGGEDEDSEGE